MRPAGPQNESPRLGGTHAPSTRTSPSAHAHRPDASRVESRGQAAAHAIPWQGAWAAHPIATAPKREDPLRRVAEHPIEHDAADSWAMMATFLDGTPDFAAGVTRLQV